uniref:Uncharacterized protein n=1 Tax=Vitis vinifera TaxID=29760 RepID=F6GYE0_VITVI
MVGGHEAKIPLQPSLNNKVCLTKIWDYLSWQRYYLGASRSNEAGERASRRLKLMSRKGVRMTSFSWHGAFGRGKIAEAWAGRGKGLELWKETFKIWF